MSEKQFTYLLGAGASANPLPVVADFPKRLLNRYSEFNTSYTHDFNNFFLSNLTYEEKQELFDIHKEFDELSKNSTQFNSIDTFAKKLFLQNDIAGFNRVKRILSNFLTIEQTYHVVDKRYDSFLASLLQKDSAGNLTPLPHNIKVLSWNYDYQFELSMTKFKTSTYPEEIDKFINICPSKHHVKKDGFGIFKLNGTACGFINGKKIDDRAIMIPEFEYREGIMMITKESRNEMFKRIIGYNHTYKASTSTNIHFAWENDDIPLNTRELAKEATKATNILVVVGYSFPVFNREIDRDIINNMKNLEKIYFQIPTEDIDGVIERFRAIKDFEPIEKRLQEQGRRFIEKITNKDEFFIPYEFGVPDKIYMDTPMFSSGRELGKHHY